MAHALDRRSFLLGSAGLAAAASAAFVSFPLRPASAQSATTLTVGRRTLDVRGRAASVFGIVQPDGRSGIELEPGDRFNVELVNNAGEATMIHWHGQKPPWRLDGFPDDWRPMIADGAREIYDYEATPGTHWMHSHHGLQEQLLMAAPLIVRTAEDVKADVQEVTVILHDFTFRDPEEILAELTGGRTGTGMAGMDMGGMSMGGPATGMGGMAMGGMAMDLNDVDYDAFLANDRTLDDPLVVRTERGGRVRVRLINAGASTAFWIDLGGLTATLVAVDGNPVVPVTASRFPMSMSQRLDLMVEVPAGAAVPILAQVEGKRERTGIVLAAPGVGVEKVPGMAAAEAPPLDLALETTLRATAPLADRPADLVVPLALTGDMAAYVWSINGRAWPDVDRPVLREGQRVVLAFENRTGMAHPMHLHGHAFEVIEINGTPLRGAMRDTILLPPNASAKVAFDADNPGRWPLHCHNLYHMDTGMLSEVIYDTYS